MRLILTFTAAIISISLVYLHRLEGAYDPDRYYHLAVSKIYAEQGTPRTLDAVEGLGWNHLFSEKEYFFHKLTQIGHQLAKEKGVLAVSLALSGTLFTFLFIVGYSILPSFWTLPVWLLSLSASVYFLTRMCFLRPHVLSVLLLMILTWALLNKRKKAVFVTCAIFALSYHAFYLPIIVSIMYCLSLGLLSPQQGWRKNTSWVLISVLGLSTGLLLNPLFPENILMGVRHLWIALFEMRNLALDFGQELIPWRSDTYFLAVLGLLISIATGLSVWFLRRDFKQVNYLFLLISTSAFVILGALSPRGLEIAAPFCLLLNTAIVAHHPYRKTVLVLLLASWATQWQSFAQVWSKPNIDEKDQTQFIEGLRKVAWKSPARVYNCEWDSTPYLFYANPNARFVDLLDPSFLFVHNREFAIARYNLRLGQVPDPYSLIKKSFDANYVLCRNEVTNAQFEQDPRFKRIYPPTQDDSLTTRLYELSTSPSQRFVDSIEVAYLDTLAETQPELAYLKIQPSENQKYIQPNSNYKKGEMFDFMPFFREKYSKLDAKKLEKGAFCVVLKPTPEEIKRHRGAELLGLGGGRNIRVWLNKKSLYHSIVPSVRAQTLEQFVRLGHPLSTKDQLEVVVCSATQAAYLSIGLSFWTQAQIDETCRWKEWKLPEHMKNRMHWKYLGYPEINCMGKIALPTY